MKTEMRKLLPLLLAACFFASCVRRPPVVSDPRPVLTVSYEPLRYFVETLAGDRYRVVTIAPPDAVPETYEPTPRQMVEVSNSMAYFRFGTLGFEGTRLRRITQSAPHLYAVNTSEGITLMEHGESSDSEDPHIWLSPANVRIMAHNIFQALCNIDKDSTKYYSARLQRFETFVDSVDAVVRERLASVSSRTFLINHPALGYFARDYGLRQICVEHDGKEASAARMASLIRACRKERVNVIFLQKAHVGRTARRIAEETGIRLVEVHPLAYDWGAEMLHLSEQLARHE